MIVHSGYIPFMYFKEWQAEKSAVFWQKFMSDKPADFRLYVENVLEDEPYMLAEMMKQIKDPRIGICLDVGHAHYMGENLYNTIKLYGKRLIALHIHDNNRMDDLHLLPFHGTLKWDDVLLGLRAVDYAGDFTFEIQNATRRAPEELYPQLCRTAFEIGQYLLRRYDALA